MEPKGLVTLPGLAKQDHQGRPGCGRKPHRHGVSGSGIRRGSVDLVQLKQWAIEHCFLWWLIVRSAAARRIP
jgi:hypothetical protein